MTTAHDDDQDHDMTPVHERRGDTGETGMKDIDTSRDAVERLVQRHEYTISHGVGHHEKIIAKNTVAILRALLARAEAAEKMRDYNSEVIDQRNSMLIKAEAERDAANAEAERLREVLAELEKASTRYHDATEHYFSDSDYDADGLLSDSSAELHVVALPKGRAALQENAND